MSLLNSAWNRASVHDESRLTRLLYIKQISFPLLILHLVETMSQLDVLVLFILSKEAEVTNCVWTFYYGKQNPLLKSAQWMDHYIVPNQYFQPYPFIKFDSKEFSLWFYPWQWYSSRQWFLDSYLFTSYTYSLYMFSNKWGQKWWSYMENVIIQ